MRTLHLTDEEWGSVLEAMGDRMVWDGLFGANRSLVSTTWWLLDGVHKIREKREGLYANCMYDIFLDDHLADEIEEWLS